MRWALAVIVVLGVADAWVVLHRSEGYNFKLVSYAAAYLPAEAPLATVREAPAEIGRDRSSLLVDGSRHPLAELVAGVDDYPREHVAEVRRLLAPLRLAQAPTTLEKLERVYRFLMVRLPRHGGPPIGYQHIPAYEQYVRATQHGMGLHCGSLAVIFTLFATVAGIPTRVVDVDHGGGRGAHAFNEVYLPELQRWAYTDLTFYILSVRAGAGGPPLNAVELARLQEAHAESALIATVMDGDRLVDRSYLEAGAFARTALNPNAYFVFAREYDAARYTPSARMLRYVLRPELSFALHGEPWRYYLRVGLLYATFAAVLLAAALLVRRLVSRRHGMMRRR